MSEWFDLDPYYKTNTLTTNQTKNEKKRKEWYFTIEAMDKIKGIEKETRACYGIRAL